MSKETTIIALGILVALTPHLGIPGSWRTALLLALGAGIALIGFLLRGEALSRGVGAHGQRRAPGVTFVDSTPPRHEHTEGTPRLN